MGFGISKEKLDWEYPCENGIGNIHGKMGLEMSMENGIENSIHGKVRLEIFMENGIGNNVHVKMGFGIST